MTPAESVALYRFALWLVTYLSVSKALAALSDDERDVLPAALRKLAKVVGDG